MNTNGWGESSRNIVETAVVFTLPIARVARRTMMRVLRDILMLDSGEGGSRVDSGCLVPGWERGHTLFTF